MVAALIHGLVDNSYFLIDLSMITWFLLAIAGLHGRQLRDLRLQREPG